MSAASPISTAAAWLLGSLLFLPGAGADAHTSAAPLSRDASSDPVLLTLTEAEQAQWIERARADLAAATDGIGTDAERQHRALVRAFAEPDRGRREARLHVWLTEYIGPAPADEPDAALLRRLLTVEPIVRVRHHDHPGHARPAFNIAGLARNRIVEQQVRIRSLELQREPASIPAALLSPEDSVAFRAGLRALESMAPSDRSALFADPHRTFLKRPRGAAAALAMVERGWMAADTLLPLIEQAEPGIAVRAFRWIRAHDRETLSRALDHALERPALGGLPVAEAAKAADAKLRERVWMLLAERERGADAALALARHADDLEARIDAEFNEAGSLARLRMLLALRLRGTPTSLALLEELRARRLDPVELHATEAWK